MVWDKGFLGVVAEKEWDAIKAAKAAQSRRGRTRRRRSSIRRRSTITSARRLRASTNWRASKPATSTTAFQVAPRASSRPNTSGRSSRMPAWVRPARWSTSRTAMSPAGAARRKRISCRTGVAAILQMPQDDVHVIWTTGPGSYGRSDADDCAAGRRGARQGRRQAGARCNICAIRAPAGTRRRRRRSIRRAPRSTPSGNVVAYDFLSKGFSRVDVNTNGSQPKRHAGRTNPRRRAQSGDGFGVPEQSYGFANKRTAWETIAPLLDRASPLRTAHMRDPVGPQIHFASESFIDEAGRGAQRGPGRIPAALCAKTRATSPSSRRRRRKRAGSRGRRRATTRAATRSPAAASPTRNAARPASP